MSIELLICLRYEDERSRLAKEFEHYGLPYQPVWEGKTTDGFRQCYFRTDVAPLSHPSGKGVWLKELPNRVLSIEKQFYQK